MTPEQQAQETDAEFLKRIGIDGHLWAKEFCKYYPDLDEGHAITWFCNAIERGRLAGHAAGIQAERERIWAEIDNNWQGTSWRMLVKRIIFGET